MKIEPLMLLEIILSILQFFGSIFNILPQSKFFFPVIVQLPLSVAMRLLCNSVFDSDKTPASLFLDTDVETVPW